MDEEEGTKIEAKWTGEGFRPDSPAAAAWCQRHVRPWEKVTLTVHQGRSMKSHRHLFPWLKDAWESLPEEHRGAPWAASPEHLRKYALIKSGFYDVRLFPVASEEEAARWMPILRAFDSFSVVVTTGSVVLYYTAQSQKMTVMGKDRFQRSKQAVLEFVADLLGIYPEELARVGRKRKDEQDAG